MSFLFGAAFFAALLGSLWLSLRGQKAVKTSVDYSLAGRKLGAGAVSWVIIGTLVGGASTVGTVQVAFDRGLEAWIFTLGGGIACLILGLVFARPLREQEVVTVSEYLGRYYGPKVQLWSSAFTSLGMFIQIVSQFLSAMAILAVSLHLGRAPSFLLTFALLFGFVGIGGMGGTGLLGKLKLYLLYIILLILGGLALSKAGGISPILQKLPAGQPFFQLFSTGFGKGASDLLATIVGVVSTQSYLQAIFAAKDVQTARKGALLAAIAVPPIGLLGILIGLYLRGAHPELAGHSAQALPFFIREALPAPLAGLFMAGLLIVVLGTASGLVLGVTTNLFNDFLKPLRLLTRVGSGLLRIRACAVLVLTLSLGLVLFGLDSAILDWSYLSMGLRGSAVFLGLTLAVLLRKHINIGRYRAVVYALPVVYLLWAVLTHN